MLDTVNRDPAAPGAVTQEPMMTSRDYSSELGQVLDRMGTKPETLEQAVEAVVGYLDTDLVAYARGEKVPTVHNPTNFEPRDYEVEDYLDNKRPVYCGGHVEEYGREVAQWEADMLRVLGADWRAKAHRCAHCGNGSVRWITAVRHIPTGDVVVFGAVCTDRLGFANKHAFKLAQLQARDEARKVRFTIWNKRQAFLDAHPEITEALVAIARPEHAKNFFARDVLAKLDQYGDLTDRQVNAVVASLARDVQFAERKKVEDAEPKGDAPTGRVKVTGTVLSTKLVEGFQGGTTMKMLLKLENNSKVWLTAPSRYTIDRGDVLTVTATFEVSRDDKSFAFGKRPTLHEQKAGGQQ